MPGIDQLFYCPSLHLLKLTTRTLSTSSPCCPFFFFGVAARLAVAHIPAMVHRLNGALPVSTGHPFQMAAHMGPQHCVKAHLYHLTLLVSEENSNSYLVLFDSL